jgi:hypothetical protein
MKAAVEVPAAMDGLWAMVFSTEDGGPLGAGVLYARDGKLWGGDNAFVWHGEVRLSEGGIDAIVQIRSYIKGARPIFEGLRDPNSYILLVRGGYDPDRFWSGCRVKDQVELTCSVELRKMAP